jgi:indole-3-glycerol phosphate synthase
MSDVLKEMIINAERTVASGYYDLGEREPRGPALTAALLGHPVFPVIAEVKMASPSHGRLAAHSPEDLISKYVAGGAAALSVLTEPVRFLGSLDALRKASRTGLPVLMKDFIVSERQLRAAAAIGAGTVLLIQEVFDTVPRARRDELIARAHELGLEVLLEAESEASLLEAMNSEADALGINQRNLRTLEMDRTKGARLLPLAVNASRPVVVMSGLKCRREIEEIRDLGASGVLIGGALASSNEPTALLRQLEVSR